jgi:truncated hemoglobin YjbI
MRISRVLIVVVVIAATVVAGGAVVSATACKSKRGETLRTGPLYRRVEERAGLDALAGTIATTVAADATFGPRFAAVDMARFRERLAAFLCAAARGPCAYDGRLSDAWQGVTLADDEFIAFLEVVVAGMNEAQLPQQEQNDLLDLMMKAHEAEGL